MRYNGNMEIELLTEEEKNLILQYRKQNNIEEYDHADYYISNEDEGTTQLVSELNEKEAKNELCKHLDLVNMMIEHLNNALECAKEAGFIV